ncbi:MAG: NAD kinase [Bacteroidales bacterium]|jgi:NAD+ kinase|nr:NAD kinase [Bacteroidales bacterium]NCU34864.1 NAD kinase [Candidatus Falkowbacteria bacterium]MDD2631222.1 NAD kinase [Bacteroidales bacterium]MDD3130880.1 NAD kinase [Bacteroidales bacterium]MDD3525996.1 NAD kinase [Bacteroidales bacterium]
MKIGLFGKNVTDKGIQYLQQLVDKLKRAHCTLLVYEPFLNQIRNKITLACEVEPFNTHADLRNNCDLLFSIGGDGTMLGIISLVRDSGIPVLGINLGRLGFLSSISRDEILPAIDEVIAGNYQLEQRTLISLERPEGLFGEMNFALNELSLTKTDNTSLAVIEVFVDNKFLNTYWADGLLVATPTGSTAYSLSCYGPIISPDSENFVITPIATHNLTVRPIVVPDSSVITLKLSGRNKQYLTGLDSRYKTISNTEELVVKRAGFRLNLIQLPNKDFFTTLREKLLWGKDQRN